MMRLTFFALACNKNIIYTL